MAFHRETVKSAAQSAFYELAKTGVFLLAGWFGIPKLVEQLQQGAPQMSATAAWLWSGLAFLFLVFGALMAFAFWRPKGLPGTPLTPVRALERHYMVLTNLKDELRMLTGFEDLSDGSPSETASTRYYQIDRAVEKLRSELINLAPEIFSVSTVLDFQKSTLSPVDTKTRVTQSIDTLMDRIYRHWQKSSQEVGITPIKFGATPMVKLDN